MSFYKNALPWKFLSHIARQISDHSPLVVSVRNPPSSPKPFRFHSNKGLDHDNFLQFVKQTWSTPVSGLPFHVLQSKLQIGRQYLRKWNWETFGNLQVAISKAQDDIIRFYSDLQQVWTQSSFDLLSQAKDNLTSLLFFSRGNPSKR